jgi:hypothetical protein
MKFVEHTIKDARGPADGAAPAFVNADAGEKVRSGVVETPRSPAARVAPSGAAARVKHDAVHRREKFIEALPAVRAKLDAIACEQRQPKQTDFRYGSVPNRVKDLNFRYQRVSQTSNTFLLSSG